MDREEAELIARNAYRMIQLDPELWRLWNDAKEPKDRDLLMVHAVFRSTWDKAYDAGYEDGGYDMRYYIEREGL